MKAANEKTTTQPLAHLEITTNAKIFWKMLTLSNDSDIRKYIKLRILLLLFYIHTF